MRRKPIIILSLAVLFTLLTAAYAYSENSEEAQPNQKTKQIIVFNQGMLKKDLVDFVKKYDLKVISVTFKGDGFSCGGTIKSIDEIDSLINGLVEGWKVSLTQDQIPYENKVKIREHIKLAEDDLLKAESIEFTNGISEGLVRDKLVNEIYTYDLLNKSTYVIYKNGQKITYTIDAAGNVTSTTTTYFSSPTLAVFYIGKSSYYLDGREVNMDATPFLSGGRALVPVRYLAEALGAETEWDEAERKITIREGGSGVALTIGSTVLTRGKATFEMDTAPLIVNGRTYLPARFVAEVFEYSVAWHDEEQSVTLSNEVNLNYITAQNFLDTIKQGDFNKAFDYVRYYDVGSDLKPETSYEKAKGIWVSRMISLKEDGIYLQDYKDLKVYLDDGYPRGGVTLLLFNNGEIEEHRCSIHFANYLGWRSHPTDKMKIEDLYFNHIFAQAASGDVKEVQPNEAFALIPTALAAATPIETLTRQQSLDMATEKSEVEQAISVSKTVPTGSLLEYGDAYKVVAVNKNVVRALLDGTNLSAVLQTAPYYWEVPVLVKEGASKKPVSSFEVAKSDNGWHVAGIPGHLSPEQSFFSSDSNELVAFFKENQLEDANSFIHFRIMPYADFLYVATDEQEYFVPLIHSRDEYHGLKNMEMYTRNEIVSAIGPTLQENLDNPNSPPAG